MGEGEPESPADIAALFVRMAKERDKAAFAAIFRHCAPKIMEYMIVRANGILPIHVLEEVCQEALATVWRDCSGFDPSRDDAIIWVFAIARKYAIQELHDQMQRSDIVEILSPSSHTQWVQSVDLDGGMDVGSRMERLRRALSRLPPQDAEIVRDVYLHGKTHTQIAEARNLPVGTVKAKIWRALESMRKAVAEQVP